MPASVLRSRRSARTRFVRAIPLGFAAIVAVSVAAASPVSEFPDLAKATLKEGVFVPPANLALISPGMSKRQIYALVGAPHFHEGLFRERRWDFIFNFYTGVGREYRICQYQIRFDPHMRLASAAFNSTMCRDTASPATERRQSGVLGDKASSRTPIAIHFDFGSAILSADAHMMLARFVSDNPGFAQLEIIGHTDTAGRDAFNDVLSLKRADAVANALINLGVAREHVQISGRGERDPAFATADGTPELRNRRSDVIIRF